MLNKVFIVDDNAEIRTLLSKILSSVDLETECFTDGDQFLSQYTGESGVALLDLRMPKMSGRQVQQHLLSKGYTLPIIFISGHGDIDQAVEALKAGAQDFITKPFKNQDVIDAVNTALKAEQSANIIAKQKMKATNKFNQLTPREKQILDLIANAHKTKEIAEITDTSPNTVEVHRAQIMKKMQVKSLAQLVSTVVKNDLVDIKV